MLGVNGATDSKGRVELFERGYGKDAAGIAKEAITYGVWAAYFFQLCYLLILFAQPRKMILTLYLSILLEECRTTSHSCEHLPR
jgi:hypothetical protein